MKALYLSILDFLQSYPFLGALWRFVRAAGAYGLGAAIWYLLNHYGELPISAVWVPLIGFFLQALDKFLREQGWITYN